MNAVRTPPAVKFNAFIVFTILLAFTVALRAPYFHYSYTDWDETCFIVVGNDLLHGYLPYEHGWCTKAPLAFFFYASLIALFGKNLFLIHAGGAVYITFASFIVYLAGRATGRPREGFFAALLVSFFASMVLSGMAVMTEHVALVPLALVTYFLTRDATPRRLIYLGFFAGLAAMIRTNLSLILPAAIVCSVFIGGPGNRKQQMLDALRIALAGAVPVLLTVLMYVAHGSFDKFWLATVRMPLHYAGAEASSPAQSAKNVFNFLFSHHLNGSVVFVFALAASLFRVWRYGAIACRTELRCAVMMSVAMLSIIATGAQYPHYMIQLLPFTALPASMTLLALLNSGVGKFHALAPLACAIALLCALHPSYRLHYVGSDSHFALADYVISQQVQGQYIFSPDECLVYFLTDTQRPTLEVHPAVFGKPHLLKAVYGENFSMTDYISMIQEKKPALMILNNRSQRALDMRKELLKYYTKVQQIDHFIIYKPNAP